MHDVLLAPLLDCCKRSRGRSVEIERAGLIVPFERTFVFYVHLIVGAMSSCCFGRSCCCLARSGSLHESGAGAIGSAALGELGFRRHSKGLCERGREARCATCHVSSMRDTRLHATSSAPDAACGRRGPDTWTMRSRSRQPGHRGHGRPLGDACAACEWFRPPHWRAHGHVGSARRRAL